MAADRTLLVDVDVASFWHYLTYMLHKVEASVYMDNSRAGSLVDELSQRGWVDWCPVNILNSVVGISLFDLGGLVADTVLTVVDFWSTGPTHINGLSLLPTAVLCVFHEERSYQLFMLGIAKDLYHGSLDILRNGCLVPTWITLEPWFDQLEGACVDYAASKYEAADKSWQYQSNRANTEDWGVVQNQFLVVWRPKLHTISYQFLDNQIFSIRLVFNFGQSRKVLESPITRVNLMNFYMLVYDAQTPLV